MKIVMCNGGLGNQTFQYIFSRFVELEGGEACYLNNAAFCRKYVEHNGFEIARVFPKARYRLLSTCFTEDVWQYMVNGERSIIQQLRDAGEDFTMIAETQDYQFNGNVVPVPCNQFSPWIAEAKGNIYYHGYWINREYLKSKHSDILRNELQFAELRNDQNKRYEEQIEKTASVALHVRRGDFVNLGRDASLEKYRMGISAMRNRVENAQFFVFSDDLDWCRTNQEHLGLHSNEVTFVSGNERENSYMDMQLMSYCKNVILVHGSSFSYLATLLNRNESVLVYNITGRQV